MARLGPPHIIHSVKFCLHVKVLHLYFNSSSKSTTFGYFQYIKGYRHTQDVPLVILTQNIYILVCRSNFNHSSMNCGRADRWTDGQMGRLTDRQTD